MPDDLPLPEMPERESANEVLLQLSPVLAQIPERELIRVRVTPDRAWEQTRELHRRFAELLPQLPEEYSEQRTQRILTAYQQILDLGMAYIAADLQLELAKRRKKSPELLALEVKIKAADSLLSEWAQKVFSNHPVEGGLVKRLLAGRGVSNAARDVLGFCAMFERQKAWLEANDWQPVLRRNGVTEDYIRTYEKIATEWLFAVGEPNAIPDGMLLRSQAYVALDRAYRELVRTGRDLRPDLEWPLLAPKGVGRSSPKSNHT